MSEIPQSPYQTNPPTGRRLLVSVITAAALAALVLVVVVLPAEYGIDPTGIGSRLGLAQMSQKGGQATTLTDTLAGNENIEKAQIPEVGEPLPLPNPAVHQGHAEAPKSETVTVTLPANGETEVKTVLATNQVVLYSWQVDKGLVYVDYHGHSPDWENKEAFVRYQEAQDGISGAHGSLVAPFAGEHGWYWLNLNDFPVVITLTVSGYYDKVVNYSLNK
ncbi:MAG: hypothetical protein AB7T07_08930 [Steroidobacteraceae bacterium]